MPVETPIRLNDSRLDETDQRKFADYLRGINDPVEKATLGKAWMEKHGASITGASEIATILVNCIPDLLSIVRSK